MRRRILQTTLGIFLLLCVTYAALRFHATKVAHHEINRFFADFSAERPSELADDLPFRSQSHDEAQAIVSRNLDALRNFRSSEITPRLNLMLDGTRVKVSWHLSIVFARFGHRWRPTHFDEYPPSPRKA